MRYVLIFIYVAVSILFFVLNWDLFTTALDVDFGFGIFSALPFVVLQIIGLLFLAVFAIVDMLKDLKHDLKLSELQNKVIQLEKDAEISALKSTIVQTPIEPIEVIEPVTEI